MDEKVKDSLQEAEKEIGTELQGKYQEKMKELLDNAQKKKNVLEYQEVVDAFGDLPLQPEEIERVYDQLESSGVDVIGFIEDSSDAKNDMDLSLPESIRIDDPSSVGADLVAGAVGALAKYRPPLVVIDMGTATTVTYVDEEKCFRGGAIIPGVGISLEALANGTSQLPMIGLDSPGKAIGTNTVDCMKSGILYGQASLLDGMIGRFREETGRDAVVVATGGLAKLIIPYCKSEITLDNELMLRGLQLIYERNQKKQTKSE